MKKIEILGLECFPLFFLFEKVLEGALNSKKLRFNDVLSIKFNKQNIK